MHDAVGKSVAIGGLDRRIIRDVFRMADHNPLTTVRDDNEGMEWRRRQQTKDLGSHGILQHTPLTADYARA